MPKEQLLTPALKRPLDKMAMSNDGAVLHSLCGFLNSAPVANAQPEDGEMSAAAAIASTTPDAESQAAQANAGTGNGNRATQPAPAVIDFSRIAYTGRLCAGKDHIAGLTGATIEGFARPLYHLAEHFFGIAVDATTGKDLPGMRVFLQTAGAWGRGTVSNEYPYTPARAVFITAIRSLGAAGVLDNNLGVTWDDFGRNDNLWVNAALIRLSVAKASRNAVTNVRFANEFKRLTELGWSNWHVMTSPKEWEVRLTARGIKPDAAILRDASEQLAASLDAQVIKEISRAKTGAKLRCIWNSDTPVPSPRLWTVQEFLNAAGAKSVEQPQQYE